MKTLLLLLAFLAASSMAHAQSDLVGILFKGRVEYYWVLYRSADGRVTKVTNFHSGIGFFFDTQYLTSITVERPLRYQTRVVRAARG